MRRVLVRLHRWAGIALAFYVTLICLTGSVLVYRPELYRLFEPQPHEVPVGTRQLSNAELLEAAGRAFPERRPIEVWRADRPDHAATIDFEHRGGRSNHLFDPYTGRPVGPALPLGFCATTFLLRLHTELAGGETGRLANGAFALGLVFLALTGVLAWRPRRARERAGGLRRLHLTAGIWSAIFVLMWGITGFHLVFPDLTMRAIEHVAPLDMNSQAEWVGDTITYWLAYAHFGRFGGVVPGCARGSWCADVFKLAWTLIALAPAFLAVSGLILWVRARVRRTRVRRSRPSLRH